MKGNFHVRFLGEGRRGNTLPLPDNLTSQFWANVYLKSGPFCQARTAAVPPTCATGTIFLFADNTDLLWEWRAAIVEHLESLRLTLHEQRAQPRPVTEGIPFLGFIAYPTHRRLKRRNGIQFRRRLQAKLAACAQGEITFEELDASVQGWVAHVRYGDTWGLRRTLLSSISLPKTGKPVPSIAHPGGMP